MYGNREGVSLANFSATSTSKILYAFIQMIEDTKKYSDFEYTFDINDGFVDWGSYCDVGEYFNFIFYVKLSCDSAQLKSIIQHLVDIYNNPPKVSTYLAKDYINLEKITDSKKIKILNTNTKTRRLGYFRVLADFFRVYPQTPVNYFNERFETYAIKFDYNIQQIQNQKGVIKSNQKGILNGNSAKPYLELASELEFINSLNRVVTYSKKFRVYVELIKDNNISNPFNLSLVDKIFFSEVLFREDFLYITVLLEELYVQQNLSFKQLRSKYQHSLLNKLKHFKEENFPLQERKIYEDIGIVYDRIHKWERPDRYLEHVLMPRLNWLNDLGYVILSISVNREVAITISATGKRLFECLCDWYDLNTGWILNSHGFMDKYFPHIFAKTYGLKINATIADDDLRIIIRQKIEKCFDIFKTMTYNRVTLSQTIQYIQYSLLLEFDYWASSEFINKIIRNDLSNYFIYKFQHQFNDGYLQKTNR